MKHNEPNPENGSLADLEVVLKSSASRNLAIRLLAIRALIQGHDIDATAQFLDVSARTIYNWIDRWNEGGIDALADQPKSGRPSAIRQNQRAKITDLLEHPENAGQTHWTAVKLHGYLKAEEAIQLGYSTFIRWLHHENYRLKTPRSWPVDQDQEARKQFQENLQPLLKRDDLEVWFADESGFLGDPRPRRVWAKKGSKPTTPSTGLHLRESVIGAVCPRSGALSALIVERVNSDVFQVFLNQLAEETHGKRIILILDNATWHKAKNLTWHNLEPMYLPAYSPDMNPIERFWLVMKARYFTQWYTKEWNVLFNRIFDALRSFMNETQVIQSVCRV